MFQSPYGDYLVRNHLDKNYTRTKDQQFQSPYGDYLVRNIISGIEGNKIFSVSVPLRGLLS